MTKIMRKEESEENVRYLISQVVDFPQHTLSSRFNFLEKSEVI